MYNWEIIVGAQVSPTSDITTKHTKQIWIAIRVLSAIFNDNSLVLLATH